MVSRIIRSHRLSPRFLASYKVSSRHPGCTESAGSVRKAGSPRGERRTQLLPKENKVKSRKQRDHCWYPKQRVGRGRCFSEAGPGRHQRLQSYAVSGASSPPRWYPRPSGGQGPPAYKRTQWGGYRLCVVGSILVWCMPSTGLLSPLFPRQPSFGLPSSSALFSP